MSSDIPPPDIELVLYNTLSAKKEVFVPLKRDDEDKPKVGMYVCGPTVYDRAHIGNARSVVVYDVLVRLLRHLYGAEHVNYVRNITDVDDKINAAATKNGETIQALTKRVTGWFHDDMDALGCERPTTEPRATEHIADIITMIEQLIARGCAYLSEGHVLFDVSAAIAQGLPYGALSGRKLEDLRAGARVEVESYKRNPEDFVLWKPTPEGDDPSSVFDSPWGKGRPGWHIECSAMSTRYLGQDFDIHGGGADLKFPHHENEIAQSCCANPDSHFATTWVHNGFVTVEGEKMSKSLGNFTTVRELLDTGIAGETIRLVFLMTHYRKPLDWTEKAVADAKKTLDGWYRALHQNLDASFSGSPEARAGNPSEPPDGSPPPRFARLEDDNYYPPFLTALTDDLNLPKALACLHDAATAANKGDATAATSLLAMGQFLGILQQPAEAWLGSGDAIPAEITQLAEQRIAAKKAKDFPEADRLRDTIAEKGYIMRDTRDGYELERM